MTILIFLAAVVILILICGGYTFFTACVRRKELPWLEEHALRKTPYGRFYEHISAGDAWLSKHNAQDVTVTSYDGLKLHARWVPAKNPRGTMLLVHGYRSCILTDFGLVFDFYHALGMNLLLPDQRSHGKSQGRYITFGVKESRDMLTWLSFHNETYGKLPVFLSGLSMGASTVMYLADEKLPGNVLGMIADCGFTSPKDIISTVFTRKTHLPAAPFMWAAELFARLFAGFSLSQKDTRTTLAANRLPILMVHGTADTFVPCYMTEEAYAVCTGTKKLFLVEGAAHGVSYLKAKESYSAQIVDFLNRYLEAKNELRCD